MKKDLRYSCYPFMREKSCLVDYEIRTDSLTTRVGVALALIREDKRYKEIFDDLSVIQPLCYHANGSVRGNLAITEDDLQWLSSRYDYYVQLCGEKIKQFLLPQGCIAASMLHVCRSEAKKSYRALHKVSEEKEVPEILFQFLGLLANVFFVMAVNANQLTEVDEISFISKSYKHK